MKEEEEGVKEEGEATETAQPLLLLLLLGWEGWREGAMWRGCKKWRRT